MLVHTEAHPTNWDMSTRENPFLAVAYFMPVHHRPIRLMDNFLFVNDKRRNLHPVLQKQIKRTEEFLDW